MHDQLFTKQLGQGARPLSAMIKAALPPSELSGKAPSLCLWGRLRLRATWGPHRVPPALTFEDLHDQRPLTQRAVQAVVRPQLILE